MKKKVTKTVQMEAGNMRAEYDFIDGVRGKHYRAMEGGYTITIHKEDGTTITKNITPKEGEVVLEPDIRAYFPDSKSVNRALRCLIPLLQKNEEQRRRKPKKSFQRTLPVVALLNLFVTQRDHEKSC